MAVDHVQMVFTHRSGLVRDQIVGSWTFETDLALDATSMGHIETALTNFYNTAATGATKSMGQYMAACMSRTTPPLFKHYDVTAHLAGSAAGSPIRVQPGTVIPGMSSTFGLPSEVAACLSFHTAYGADVEFGAGNTRPRNRDRGRVYLGPLADNTRDQDVLGVIRVGSQFRDDILAQCTQLVADLTADIEWVVWSRKSARVGQVVAASLDDTFDVQRRRGERPVASVSVGLP